MGPGGRGPPPPGQPPYTGGPMGIAPPMGSSMGSSMGPGPPPYTGPPGRLASLAMQLHTSSVRSSVYALHTVWKCAGASEMAYKSNSRFNLCNSRFNLCFQDKGDREGKVA